MCGEHFIISARGLGKTGSSPHVRGALVQDFLQGLSTGDHPRMCGEHSFVANS